MTRFGTLVFIAVLAAEGSAHAAGKGRRVEVRYDTTQPSHAGLEIWIDCVHPKSADTFADLTGCEWNVPDGPNKDKLEKERRQKTQLAGADAAGFVFSDKDKVTFVLLYKRDDGKKRRGEIVHSITGTGVSDKDLEALKKIVGATEEKKANESLTDEVADTAEIQALTDDFEIGQKIVVTFSLKETSMGDDGKDTEKTTLTRGPFAFRVGGTPRFKLSYGIAFSTAPNPIVAIEKTSTVVEFEKDGKKQQAYQQTLALRDAEPKLALIQALVTQLNFRLMSNIFGSAGFQVNQKIFEEPMLGLTYRHQAGNKLGVYLTGGVHFSRETAIREDGGFKPGFRIDPTQPLTVDEIPTETNTKHRFVLALTVDFR
jgi:hypothetical protein